MGKHFEHYDTAKAAARDAANATGRDVGIEKASALDPGWLVFRLPNPADRCGHELRCEVVRPD